MNILIKMGISINVSDQSCGAEVTGIDLKKDITKNQVLELRDLWLKHHVLSFPNQLLDDDALERFTLYFGSFGDDPFIAPIPGRKILLPSKEKRMRRCQFLRTIGIQTGVFKKNHKRAPVFMEKSFQLKVVILYLQINTWH